MVCFQGVYTFTITDANGCTPAILPLPIFIAEPPQISNNGSHSERTMLWGCHDGLIDITVTNANGPFNYNWIGPLFVFFYYGRYYWFEWQVPIKLQYLIIAIFVLSKLAL